MVQSYNKNDKTRKKIAEKSLNEGEKRKNQHSLRDYFLFIIILTAPLPAPPDRLRG